MTVRVTYEDLYLGDSSRENNPVARAVRRRLSELNFPVEHYTIWVAHNISLIPLGSIKVRYKYSMPPQVKDKLRMHKVSKVTPFWFNAYRIPVPPLYVPPVL